MNQLQQVFYEKKSQAMDKLNQAIHENKVDIESLSLVHKINDFNEYYTTSSCAGRFVVLSKAAFRGKYTSHFVFKTHSPPIIISDVETALQRPFEGLLYINVEPPTFHIGCKSLETAIKLHQLAIDSNIGYSMFKTIKKTIIVEVRGTGMLQIPIGKEGNVFSSREYLEHIVELSNEILASEQARIKKFEDSLSQLK